MKKLLIALSLGVLAILLFFISVIFSANKTIENITPTPIETQNTLANPASQNCIKQDGQLSIQTRGDGGQYGLCTFADNQQCEEWALLRGQCPKGGLNIIGYDNKEQIYCAITGGKTLAVANATCTLQDGSVCPVDTYYNGTCPTN